MVVHIFNSSTERLRQKDPDIKDSLNCSNDLGQLGCVVRLGSNNINSTLQTKSAPVALFLLILTGSNSGQAFIAMIITVHPFFLNVLGRTVERVNEIDSISSSHNCEGG